MFCGEKPVVASPCHPTRRHAFTMIELVVVIAIATVLMALLIRAVVAVRAAADRITCVARLKQIGLAVHAYHDVNRNLPNGSDCYIPEIDSTSDDDESAWVGIAGEGKATIFYLLLPYIDQESLYRQGDCTDAAVRATIVEAYLCPLNVGMTNQYGKLTH